MAQAPAFRRSGVPASMEREYRGVSWHKQKEMWVAQVYGKLYKLCRTQKQAAKLVAATLKVTPKSLMRIGWPPLVLDPQVL